MTVLYFLYYLYCLSIFQRSCFVRFRLESGCKDKDFFDLLPNFFGSFFFKTLFRSDLTHGLSCEREKSDSEKSKSFSVQFLNLCGSLLSESGCKSTPFFSTSKIFNDFFSFIFYTKTITGWLNDVNKEKNWKQQNEKREISIHYYNKKGEKDISKRKLIT